MRKGILTLLVLGQVLLAACAAQGVEPAITGTIPAALETGLTTETPAASPSLEASLPLIETQTPEIKLPAGTEDALVAATADLAARQGIQPQEIRTVEVVAEEWSDASLGCPQPGMLYAQVITPGFRIVLQAGDQDYAYHTDRGSRVVLCGLDGAPIQPGTPSATGGG